MGSCVRKSQAVHPSSNLSNNNSNNHGHQNNHNFNQNEFPINNITHLSDQNSLPHHGNRLDTLEAIGNSNTDNHTQSQHHGRSHNHNTHLITSHTQPKTSLSTFMSPVPPQPTVDRKGTKEEIDRSQRLDKILSQQDQQQRKVHRLLLLGAGESGKSTLVKQLSFLFGTGPTREERISLTPTVHANVIHSLKTLITQSDILADRFQYSSRISNSPACQQAREFLLSIPTSAVVTPEVAHHVKALWSDPGIQLTFENRSKFQLNDSLDFFLNEIDIIASEHYIPSDEDVVRTRVKTSGIIEKQFNIGGVAFTLIDVGGQRNERKKWIHCFNGVTAVLFVAALNEYDMLLSEDATTSRMMEALNLFEAICNSQWFVKTPIILLLNKRDLFIEKVRRVMMIKGISNCADRSICVDDGGY